MEVQDTKSTLQVTPRNEEKNKENLENSINSVGDYLSRIRDGFYHG
jgi:hypothetical protein